MPMALGLGLGLPYLGAARGPYPALDLNFAAMAVSGVLDPRITFSRGTLATLTNAAGSVAYAPHNLLTYSQDLTNAAWVKSAMTPTYGVGPAPDGASTASQLLEVANSGAHQVGNVQTFSAAAYTLSIYAKPIGRQWCRLMIYDGTSFKSAYFDLVGAVAGAVSPGVTASIGAVANGFYRLSITYTCAAGTGVAYFHGAIADNGVDTYAGDITKGYCVWGAQLNIGALQPYYPTTSAAYHGPRFTFDPITHASLGLLIEEQRTNLYLWSRDFSQSAWTKQAAGCTAVLNATGVDGVASTASTITESAANLSRSIYQGVSGSAGAYSQSVSFKQTTGPTRYLRLVIGSGASDFGYVTVNMKTGAVVQAAGVQGTATYASSTVTSQTATGMWRVSLSCTLAAAPVFAFFVPIDAINAVVAGDYGREQYVGDGTTNWVLDAAQFEAGAFATTPIHTTSATVTRAADSATMTGSNFSSWFNATQGTFVAKFVIPPLVASTYKRVFSARNVADTERLEVWVNGAGTVRIGATTGGVTTETSLVAAVTAGQVCQVALAYTASTQTASLNGAAVISQSSSLNGAAFTVLDIGQYDLANILNAPIARLRYYSTALTNAQLQALTT